VVFVGGSWVVGIGDGGECGEVGDSGFVVVVVGVVDSGLGRSR